MRGNGILQCTIDVFYTREQCELEFENRWYYESTVITNDIADR